MARLQGKIARKYAAALLGLLPPQEFEPARDALHSFAEIWESSPNLQAALQSPGVPMNERLAVVKELAKRVKSGGQMVENFLGLLLENNRLAGISVIAAEFSILVAELKKLLALKISSAFPISDGEQGTLSASVKKEFGDLASISWEVHPEIIGGLKIQSGDTVLDGSIGTSLRRIGAELLE